MKIAQLLPLIVLPAMGNTEVCPIAVNPTERGICTILTIKWFCCENTVPAAANLFLLNGQYHKYSPSTRKTPSVASTAFWQQNGAECERSTNSDDKIGAKCEHSRILQTNWNSLLIFVTFVEILRLIRYDLHSTLSTVLSYTGGGNMALSQVSGAW